MGLGLPRALVPRGINAAAQSLTSGPQAQGKRLKQRPFFITAGIIQRPNSIGSEEGFGAFSVTIKAHEQPPLVLHDIFGRSGFWCPSATTRASVNLACKWLRGRQRLFCRHRARLGQKDKVRWESSLRLSDIERGGVNNWHARVLKG